MSGEGFSTPVPLTGRKHRHLHYGTTSKATDLTRTPGGTVTKVTFNDDEAERRERRLQSNLCTMLSPGCHTPRSAVHSSAKRVRQVESVTSSLSNSQLKEHYSNCIKLSTQNKINAKNAFGLHLIDHMLQLLTIQGEMTNFQVASSTLDASAKIYAGRVDSIYTDALKVLTGFGREGQNQNAAADEAEGEADGNNEGSKGTGKTKKAPSAGVNKVIEKNVRNLNINTFDLEYQVDPLFKKTSAAFDEGGVEGLLINHLHTDAGFLLSLDADEVPCHKDRPTTHSMDIPLASITSVVSVGEMTGRQLCPTFTGLFSEVDEDVTGWDIEQATKGGELSAHQVTDIGAEYSMLPCPQPAPDLATHDDDEGVDVGQMDGDDEPPQEIADLTILGSDNKMAGFIPGAAPIHSAKSEDQTSLGALILSEAIQKSDYSYFAPSVLAAWAGPKHWKIQPKTSGNAEKGEKHKRKRQSSTQFSIDFTQTPDETLLTKGKASVQLSKPVLAKRNSAQTTLPENPHTKADVLHKLFSRPKWEVRRRRGNAARMEDQLEGDWYDYGNLNDNANYCPQVEDDSDGEIDAGGGPNSPLLQDDGFFSQSQSQEDPAQLPALDADFVLTGDNLVPQPRKVQQIHIEYAKTAKRLDVKKLKGKMWNLLTSEEGMDSNDEQKAEKSGGLNFSELCSSLPSQLTNEMKKNISVPICFVCLLHLANEKCLDISGASDLTDLQIATQPTVTE